MLHAMGQTQGFVPKHHLYLQKLISYLATRSIEKHGNREEILADL